MPTQHIPPPPGAVDGAPDLGQTIKTTPNTLDRTMVGTPHAMPVPTRPGSAAKTGDVKTSTDRSVLSPTMAGQHVVTIVGDVPTQDLSSEQLLRDAPRLESGGQMCPSLNGIPLLYKLGQGGMGAVYYGVHPRLRSEVAVKVLPFHLAAQDPGMIQRFFREAQIAAKVRSPHLVSVIDVNEESGLFFLVMEFVSGCSMGQYLKKEIAAGRVGLSELDAIDAGIAASMGLDAAHQHGVIHRDLKPDNIMCPYKSRQLKTYDIKSAKLMDLGLARSEEGAQSLTGVQAAMGTPGYMAPEQALDAKTADKRSDVFGMGATIYALLAGRPPFKGDVVMKVLMATMHEPHPPITNFRPDLSPGLVDLINRCLDKRPENRFADARQLIRALKACRKVLAPDSTFGGEDEGGAEEHNGPPPTATTHLAPMASTIEANRIAASQQAVFIPSQPKPNKLGLYAGIGAAALVVVGLAVYFGRGNTQVEDPGKIKPVVEDVKPISDEIKKLVVETHNQSIQAAYEFITLKKFVEAEFKFQTVTTNDAPYTRQIPSLVTDLDKLRKDIDTARRADQFDNTVIAINLALKSNNVDEAQRQAQKLAPETPAQIEESNKLRNEISRIEKKTKNKDAFNQTLLDARNDKLKIDERLALVEKALELIPEEPRALELQKNYKAIQTIEINSAQFKLNLAKAKELFVNNNFEAANKAIKLARSLQPENKEAQDLAKQIFASAGDALQKEIAEEGKKTAFEAFNKSKEYYDKKDSAKALEQINISLANISDDDQYNTHKKKVMFLIEEQERVAELARRKSAFQEYFKEAKENLDYATDVKKAASLDIAMERINEAKALKLDDKKLVGGDDAKIGAELNGLIATLAALEAQVVERQGDLKTRKQYDDWIFESTKILDENDVDGKLATVEEGITKIDGALKILAAGKVVSAKEGVTAEELKKKLEAKKSEITVREGKRSEVAGLVADGDDAIKKGSFADALKSFKKAEGIAHDLSVAERDAVQLKIAVANKKIDNLKQIDGMIAVADKLIKDEKFDDAQAKLADAEKIMEDKRFALRKADIDAKKTALNATVNSAFDSAIAAFKGNKIADAVQGLQKVAEEHPSRADVTAALTGLREIQRIDGDIAAKTPELKQRYGVLAKIKGDTKTQKTRADEAFEKLPKLTAATAENLAKSGMPGLAAEVATMNKQAEELLLQAKNNVLWLEGMYRDEEAARKPPPPPPPVKTDPGPKPKGKGGEVEPDL